jgi:hypothetical protein
MESRLTIDFDRYEYITREADREERWDRDDTATDWTARSIQLVTRDKDYFDVIAPFKVQLGDSLIVVYAIYSTGDSFGHDSRGCKEIIDVFKSTEKAADCVRAVQATENDHNDYSQKEAIWVREDGSEGKLDYAPWNGYFESLDGVYAELLQVKTIGF